MMLGRGVGFRPRSPAVAKWVCGSSSCVVAGSSERQPVRAWPDKGTQFQLVEIEGIAGDGGVVWLALLFDQIIRVSPKTSTAIWPATSNLCFSPVPLHKLDH
jgi:hypothetical protein